MAPMKSKIRNPKSEIEWPPVTREYIHSLRGLFRGKGLLDELKKEKKKEKASAPARH